LYKAEPMPTQITKTWTAPGDDGNVGRVSGYELRFTDDTTRQFTAWNLVNVNPCAVVCDSAGRTVSVSFVVDMIPQVNYWFGLVAIDDVGNRSPVSNLVREFRPDLFAPDRITDFR
jgi:hypothetical protein